LRFAGVNLHSPRLHPVFDFAAISAQRKSPLPKHLSSWYKTTAKMESPGRAAYAGDAMMRHAVSPFAGATSKESTGKPRKDQIHE
jgi:hypothetical protein